MLTCADPPVEAVRSHQTAGLKPPVKFMTPELLFGENSLREAGFGAARLGARRPFVVTDPGLIEAGWVAELIEHLCDAGLDPVVWHSLTPNPKDHEIRAGYQQYRETGADVLVALGGGSCIDAAKGIAILAGGERDVLEAAGVDQVSGRIPPMLMVPSTAGTGADVSQFCVVTDTVRAVKVTIVGRTLVPDISVTDPRLLTTMPHELAAATGMDALTHAIEAYVSLAHNPLADVHALSAFQLIATNLRRSVLLPGSPVARAAMAQASLEAGLAFSNAILGAVHAMSHQVGGLVDAPHGTVNAVLLPSVLRFNGDAEPARFAVLARAAGLDPRPDGGDAADLLADWVRRLADDLDLPAGLRDLGVRDEHVDQLAASALEDSCLTTNPRPAGKAELAQLFREAL